MSEEKVEEEKIAFKKDTHSNNVFLYVIFSCILLSFLTSFYFFYLKKDYDFIVEVSCDPTIEECISRDCTDPANCPPNGLSEFKRYVLKAYDFKYCENEDCKDVCEKKEIECIQIECAEDEEFGESCISPEMEVN